MKRSGTSDSSDKSRKTRKVSSEMAQCSFCGRAFKKRGEAAPEPLQEQAQTPPDGPRDYKLCILNEQIFGQILSFLGNQTLTKLQAITGNYYPKCEGDLTTLCCSCDNDNPVMVVGLCLQCERERNPNFQSLVSMSDARDLYGTTKFTGILRQEDEDDLSVPMWDDRTMVARADLEKHMLDMCGSKIKGLKHIAMEDKREGRRRKDVAETIQRKAEREAILRTLPSKCASNLKGLMFLRPTYDAATIKQRAERHSTMTAALAARGLNLRDDSKLCRHFIANRNGVVDEIVDTMEEMGFLFSHTNYSSRCSSKISHFQRPYYSRRDYGWGYDSYDSCGMYSDSDDDDDYYGRMDDCRESTRKELCIEYLEKNKGFTLPRKWEACRPRYDDVVSIGADPKQVLHLQWRWQEAHDAQDTEGSLNIHPTHHA